MNSALLVAVDLIAGSFAALTGQVSSEGPVLRGEIILQRASYCDYSVVQTDQGFAFLDMGAGLIALASGHWVTGRLTERGLQTVDIDGRASLAVRVLAWDTHLTQARARLNRYGDPEWLDLAPDEEG